MQISNPRVDVEMEQGAIRRFAVDLFLGRKFVPVGVIDYTAANQTNPVATNGDVAVKAAE